MPRVVVVTYHYPPDPSVGSRRWAGIARQLARRGWEVWVVTAAAGEAEPRGVHVTTVPRRRTVRDRYRRWRLNGTDDSNGAEVVPPSVQRDVNGGPSWADRIRLEASAMIAYPDDARGWTIRAARATRGLVRTVRPDFVVSSGPPHSGHFAAWMATQGTSVPHIVDLRDPWAGPVTDAWIRSEWHSRLPPILDWIAERVVVRTTLRLICNNELLRGALSHRYNRAAIAMVPNGVDRNDVHVTHEGRSAGSTITLVHAGTIYGARGVGPLLQAMSILREKGRRVSLQLIGTIEEPFRHAITHEAEALKLETQVELLGKRSRQETQGYLAAADVAIVLAQGQEYQVPAKLYECVAISRAVLVLTEQHSGSWLESIRVGAVPVDPRNSHEVVSILEKMVATTDPRTQDPPVFFDDVVETFMNALPTLGVSCSDLLDRPT